MVKEGLVDFLSARFGSGRKLTGKSAGQYGEDIAAAFLKKKGYLIVERNFRKRFGEIDIIAEDGGTIVFAEVKTRSSDRFGSPFEAVDSRKQKKMSRVALASLSSRKLFDRPALVYGVAVKLKDGKAPDVEIVQDAFEIVEE